MSISTTNISATAAHTIAVVRALNRHQLAGLVRVARTRTAEQMAELEGIWETIAAVEPELTSALDDVSASEQQNDLGRFKQLSKGEDRESQKLMLGQAGRLPMRLTAIAFLLPVILSVTTLIAVTHVAVLLTSLPVSAALLVAGGVASSRIEKRHGIERLFINPERAAEMVWVAATDAAVAAAVQDRAGTSGLTPEQLRQLSGIWLEAGLTLDMLKPPVRTQVPAVLVAAE